MDTTKPIALTHEELNALVDGQLAAVQRAQVLARAASDPDGSDTLKAWQTQRQALQALHRGVLDEPLPATLLEAARRAAPEGQSLDSWWRWGGMAASLVLAFGVGWLANSQFSADRPSAASASAKAAGPQFARQAALAHAVYSPEVRHPVEVGAAQQEHLVQWLSKRLGKPVKVPLLTTQGYELVGGRLLPGEDGARAQFMFQNSAGVRVTLYLGALNTPAGSPAQAPAHSETAFRYSNDGPVPAFYWMDQGFGYAMSGPVAREELIRLAELVYQQI